MDVGQCEVCRELSKRLNVGTDSGQTVYKHRNLTHNRDPPGTQETDPLCTITSSGSPSAVSKSVRHVGSQTTTSVTIQEGKQ